MHFSGRGIFIVLPAVRPLSVRLRHILIDGVFCIVCFERAFVLSVFLNLLICVFLVFLFTIVLI